MAFEARSRAHHQFHFYLTGAAVRWCSAGRWASPRRCRCTSGCRMRWKAPRRCPRSSTRRRWWRRACTCWCELVSCWPLVHGAGLVIAWFGIVTAVLAALMATQQSDIKRILAYSTLSQLGYMVCAAGCSAGGWRRCSTCSRTRFSRRCCSSARARSSTRCITSRTSGRWAACAKMPITFWTFLVGTLALMGCPGFSGFFQQGRHSRRPWREQRARSFAYWDCSRRS